MSSQRPLPVYRLNSPVPEYALFYAPGFLAVARIDLAEGFGRAARDGPPAPWPEAEALHRAAVSAKERWEQSAARPFTPVCLTLYLHNACNLECAYCFSSPGTLAADTIRLAPSVVRSAAEAVAENCAAAGLPLTAVFHGGGEPTLDFGLLRSALAAVEEAAASRGLALFRYIATNGVMPAEEAHWLVGRFDLIGLSCDGPPGIQSRQRPLRGGGDSPPPLERTARIIRESGKPLTVRVTLTRGTIMRQAEIAEYVCRRMEPGEIHVEPVYAGGWCRGTELDGSSAELFAEGFFEGQAVARRYGVRWLASGSRPGEIHGPYCQVLRGVLQLTPAGTAAACFKTVETSDASLRSRAIGRTDGTGRFAFDGGRIGELRRALSVEPERCEDCFNRYHCAGECPDRCRLEPDSETPGFRCRAQKSIAETMLREKAAALCSSRPTTAGCAVQWNEM